MQTNPTEKNPAGPSRDLDWHPADIVAALWKARTTFRRLSRQHHYAAGSLNMVLRRPWPRAEQLVAAAIGVTPQAIWPSRYHPDGSPKSGRGERLGSSTPQYRTSRPAGRQRKAA
ncbi:MAG: helix-turn-helix domain-containing protein [Burkholderiales bacterium]|nr:helix-turn-helix domain-containing protein [Burkholderiales bacterium]